MSWLYMVETILILMSWRATISGTANEAEFSGLLCDEDSDDLVRLVVIIRFTTLFGKEVNHFKKKTLGSLYQKMRTGDLFIYSFICLLLLLVFFFNHYYIIFIFWASGDNGRNPFNVKFSSYYLGFVFFRITLGQIHLRWIRSFRHM